MHVIPCELLVQIGTSTTREVVPCEQLFRIGRSTALPGHGFLLCCGDVLGGRACRVLGCMHVCKGHTGFVDDIRKAEHTTRTELCTIKWSTNRYNTHRMLEILFLLQHNFQREYCDTKLKGTAAVPQDLRLIQSPLVIRGLPR